MRVFFFAALLVTAVCAAAAGPSSAVATAREQIAAGDCRSAIRLLQDAAPELAAIRDAEERAAAAGAVHFYTALAFSDCNMADEARRELRDFFRFRPDLTTIDAARYPPPFVELFKEVQRAVQSVELFDRIYPGYDRYGTPPADEVPLQIWGTNPAFQILADDEEREEWGRLRTEAERREFVRRFWARRDRGSGGRYQATIQRRVVFADASFFSPDEVRGALTDRGRVFVLLGPPARVYQSGLKRYETTIRQDRSREPLTGTLERWVYFNWQLPKGIAPKEVEFRFITQPGYGEGVMQKDFWPMKALAEAGKLPARSTE